MLSAIEPDQTATFRKPGFGTQNEASFESLDIIGSLGMTTASVVRKREGGNNYA